MNTEMVQQFFERYGQALGEGDLHRIADCWDPPAFVLSDQGAMVVQSSAEVEQFFGQAVQRYNAQGFAALQPRVAHSEALSERLISAEVWWAILDKDGVERSREHFTYILHQGSDGRYRIRVLVARR